MESFKLFPTWFSSDTDSVFFLQCGSEYKKIKFEFIRHVYGCYTSPHIACLGGCDRNLLDDFNISADRASQSKFHSILEGGRNLD